MGRFICEQSDAGIVYIHCKIGYSRSAAAVAAYLIMSDKASDVEGALAMIRRARPSVVIRPEVISALSKFGQLIEDSRLREESFLLASGHHAS
jgi:protein-tyrosine phosphatase